MTFEDPYGSEGGGLAVLAPPPAERRRGARRRAGDPPERERGGGRDGGRHEGSDGGGDGGGDGWSGGWSGGAGEGPRGDERPPGTSELAFGFLLLAVLTLFLVFIGAFVVLRRMAPDWPPAGLPGPPPGLWLSTCVLIVSSVSLARAVWGHQRARKDTLRLWLAVTTGLGLLFMAGQTVICRRMLADGLELSSNAWAAVFYSLTGLHFLHVLGGIVFLAHVLRMASNLPAGSRNVGRRLALGSTYWHFLSGIWVAVFCVLTFGA